MTRWFDVIDRRRNAAIFVAAALAPASAPAAGAEPSPACLTGDESTPKRTAKPPQPLSIVAEDDGEDAEPSPGRAQPGRFEPLQQRPAVKKKPKK